jgi:hypothetical protein
MFGGYRFCPATSPTVSTATAPQFATIYNPAPVFRFLQSFRDDTTTQVDPSAHPSIVFGTVAADGTLKVRHLLWALKDTLRIEAMPRFGSQEVQSAGRDKRITWILLYYHGLLTHGAAGGLQLSCPNQSTVEFTSNYGTFIWFTPINLPSFSSCSAIDTFCRMNYSQRL